MPSSEHLAERAAAAILAVSVEPWPWENPQRVLAVEAQAIAFHAMSGVDASVDADGPGTFLGDLLTDLMHYADARGLVFEDVLETARSHHQEEAVAETPNQLTA